MFALRSFESLRPGLLVLLGLAVLLPHAVRLDQVPCGLYQDEAFIGYNAHLILETGRDEGGRLLPLYFFGRDKSKDVKHGPFVYAAAGMFALLGKSEFSLRLTSVVLLGLFIVVFGLLVAYLFPGRFLYPGLGIAMVGLLPWFFPVSRLAFEMNFQLPAVFAGILLWYRLFEGPRVEGAPIERYRSVVLIATGLVLAFAFYTAATSRLMVPATLGLLVLCYLRVDRTRLQELALVCAAFLLGLLPFAWTAYTDGAALFGRTYSEVYLFYDRPWFYKVVRFIRQYTNYFGHFNFLLNFGDPHGRHGTGGAGAFYYSVYLLGCLGVLTGLAAIRTSPSRRFLLLALLVTPVAGAVTTGEFNVTRAILFPAFVVLFALYGLRFILERLPEGRWRGIGAALFAVVLLAEAGPYLRHYFNEYPGRSAYYFESWGLGEQVAKAQARGARRINLVERPTPGGPALDPLQFSHLEFARVTEGAENLTLGFGPAEETPGVCNIYRKSEKQIRQDFFRYSKGCVAGNVLYTMRCTD